MFQVSVGCQTTNVYDLQYSDNPLDCPEMLLGLGVGLGMLGILAIAAICCYACGKHRTQQATQDNKEKDLCTRLSRYERISRMLPWRYPRMSAVEHPVRQVNIHTKNCLAAFFPF